MFAVCLSVPRACRYRKKVEKDEDYIRTVVQLGAAVEGLVKQNNALDIYEEYFAGISAQHSSEAPSARTLTVLQDPTVSSSGVQRPVSCVNWLQDGGSKVVLSYSILDFQQQPAGTMHTMGMTNRTLCSSACCSRAWVDRWCALVALQSVLCSKHLRRHCFCNQPARRHAPQQLRVGPVQPQRAGGRAAGAEPAGLCQVQRQRRKPGWRRAVQRPVLLL